MESGPVEIGDPSHANATDALAVLFSRDGDQCLLVGQTADSSFVQLKLKLCHITIN